jgi:hypothetical protein
MDAGQSFFMATNGVLLCEGPLSVEFVEEVRREELGPGWSE